MSPNQLSADSMSAPAFTRALESVTAELGTSVPAMTPVQAESLRLFCLLMLKWNQSLNLTGARNLEDLMQEHLPDAFVIAAAIPFGASVVDVGSGGGLPALPVAILRPDLTLFLIEPRAKRVAFIRTAVRELGLQRVTVFAGRVEDWPTPPSRPSVAISRATFAPEEWVKVGSELVGPGGSVFALVTGGGVPQVDPQLMREQHPYRLPRGQARVLVVVNGATQSR